MARNFALVVGALAALILSVSAFVAVSSPARAQDLGPAFSGGSFPLLSWGATGVAYNQTTTLYTVPAGKKLIVRNFCTTTTSWYLAKNGVQFVPNTFTTPDGDFAPLFCNGRGQAVFEPGETLSIGTISTSSSTGGQYYVEASLVAE